MTRVLRSLATVLIVLVSACGAPGDESSVAPAPIVHNAQPLHNVTPGMTWRSLLTTIASEQEMRCITKITDVYVLLDQQVFDEAPGAIWPVWADRIIGIQISDWEWPHELWRCLAERTTGAVWVTLTLEELRVDGVSLSNSEFGCLTRLHKDAEFSRAVSTYFQQKHGFDDVQEDNDYIYIDEFWDLLYVRIEPYLLSCLSNR